MKLSEAMRLGAMASGQAFYFFVTDSGETCAQGAALIAVGRLHARTENHLNFIEVETAWPWVTSPGLCPACGTTRTLTSAVIAHLNNDHKWTRERIADWIEGIEPQEAAPSVPVVEAVPVEA